MRRTLYVFGANQELVEALTKLGARFIVIGGLAVQFHVPGRHVDDLDLLIDPTVQTAKAVIAALSSNPMVMHSITVEELIQPKRMQIPAKVYFYADILTPGPDMVFEEHWAQAYESRIGSTPVKVASVTTLLELLSLSTEPKHADDIAHLKAGQG
ncbi:MAG TPA: hypothetical protein PLO41_06235 [Rubrivivax sp.]|nr:hypothetical protein [Rubrivivax sp.]